MSDPGEARAAGGRPLGAHDRVGLCAACAHARAVVSGRGSRFSLCGLSASDASFPRYPRLPVLRCTGFVRATGGEGDSARSPRDPGT